MVLSLCACLTCGLLLSMRFKVFILVPASAAAALLACRLSMSAGAALPTTLALMALHAASLQAGYALTLSGKLAAAPTPRFRPRRGQGVSG